MTDDAWELRPLAGLRADTIGRKDADHAYIPHQSNELQTAARVTCSSERRELESLRQTCCSRL